ncbi:hypothetical protein JW835_05910 [bacterium]|nr:hypothetical protein [bacterium]
MKTRGLMISLLLINISAVCFGQDSIKFNHTLKGFGADLDKYRFYFPLYMNDNLKIEPEFELSYSKHGNYSHIDFEIGTGIFYIINYQRLISYFGLRTGFSYNKQQHINEYGFILSPAIGGECFIIDRFSVGVELLLKYVHSDGETEYYIDEIQDIKIRRLNTFTYLIVRFYIF